MKVLIGATPSKIYLVREFSKELKKFGIDCQIIMDHFYPPLVNHLGNWFRSERNFDRAIRDFQPDLVFALQPSKFGLAAAKAKIPFLIYLQGDYWKEVKMRRQTLKSFLRSQNFWLMERIEQKCLKDSDSIIAVCKYLENEIKKHLPEKKTHVLYLGSNPNNWFAESGITLKHPCVGLLQTANIWGKAKEMLLLPKILEAIPDVMFYWVGDGPYRNKILPQLTKYDNFKWMGKLEYPNKVRHFLSEIDVYALISGLDMTPKSLLEAQLMEKPVLATNVGGINEIMKNGGTGYLIEVGNHREWIERINELINDKNKRKKFGIAGRKYVNENFGFEKCAANFQEICNELCNIK